MNKSSFGLLLGIILFFMSSCAQYQKCAHLTINEDFLSKIKCEEDFIILKSTPISNNFSQVDALKLVYDIKNKKLYFTNSTKYKFHYDFCSSFLGYKKDLSIFNYIEYSESSNRNYILANLNHYKASDVYTLEFFSDDKIPANLIELMFKEVSASVYFKEKLYILNNANTKNKLGNIDAKKIISINELYNNQQYQPMILESSYGYLQKVSKDNFENYSFKKEDIILTDFLPNDIPFCQGIITSTFQTPLAHINILSQNRKTPNCAYKNAWNNEILNSLVGKLIKYEVREDSFYIREATIDEATKYWKNKTTVPKKNLNCNIKETRLLDADLIFIHHVNTVGGKAANFGELGKIILDDQSRIPLPEAAFAIPFYYYKQHINTNNLQAQIDLILNSDTIYNNRTRLDYHLSKLQDSILAKPIDPKFYSLLINKLKTYPAYTDFRFRSSTNAEDIPGFTGAGLYTSKTGSLVNNKKSIEQAVKKVWASLWSIRAYEELMSANIDQKNLAMGILVHRAFGTEVANGVAITKDLYREGYPAFTINIQKGETSIVLPENNEIPEQFLMKFSNYINGGNDISLDYISYSSLNENKSILSTDETKKLAKYLEAIKSHFYYKLNLQFEELDYFDFAMDIEFKLDKNTRKIYIKQARTY